MTRCGRATIGALLFVLGAGLSASPAGSQTTARVDLEAQTLVVDESPAEIVLRVSGAPDDARLRFTIYDDPALTRAQVREQHRNPPNGGSRIADFECTLAGDCREQATMIAGPDGIFTVTLADEEIGEALRGRRGALPFLVRLTDDGAVLDELATSLLVLDDSPASNERRVRVAFTSQVTVPVARQNDLRTVVDGEVLRSALASLAGQPELAVTAEIRPETLDALAATDPEMLAEVLESLNGRPLLRAPWVDMDEEAWRRAGESDQVVAQYARGNDTVEEITGAPPTGLVRLDPDAGPDTLSLLRSAGATTVLVADARLDPTTRASSPTQPFQLLDANGVAITALRTDDGLHDTLAGDDPELAAYQGLAELALLAARIPPDESVIEPGAAGADTPTHGVLLDLDRVGAEALVRLLEGIDDHPTLEITDVTALAEAELARVDDETRRGELIPTDAPDVTPLAAELETTVAGVATIARMLEPELDLLIPLIDQLQAAVSTDLSAAAADLYVERVAEEVTRLSAGISISDGNRITLTDRRTDLPLTIVNSQALPLNVEVILTAEKLRFPDGDRLALTLDPGENPITIPVETLASGDARVTATVVSPGGFFELATGTVDIRSTAISGLGLVISIVALIVLGVWWIRTILRVRRTRVAATVAAAPPDDDSVAESAPNEGEP